MSWYSAIPLVLASIAAFFIGRYSYPSRASVQPSRAPDISDHEYERRACDLAKSSAFWGAEILNESERDLYETMCSAIKDAFGDGSFPVLCQIALAAMLKTDAPKGRLRRIIMSKRPDFVIVSYAYKPIVILEYQGGDHALRGEEETAVSDDIKRTAARAAGIKLIEVASGDDFSHAASRLVDELRQFKQLGSQQYRDHIRAGLR